MSDWLRIALVAYLVALIEVWLLSSNYLTLYQR
jgi:hypothetical protein